MSQPVRNVLVIGGTGGVGAPVVQELHEAGFVVSVLTRETSSATFASDIKVFKTNYSAHSLEQAFQSQDAVVSTISAFTAHLQRLIIDTAIKAGVRVFLPSEFGADTANPKVKEVLPFLDEKLMVLEYLKSVENKISWTAIVTGALFDWAFEVANGFGGWDIPGRTVTLFDGGDIPYEATNLGQAARAVVAVLRNPETVRNQHIYVNSFTVTQTLVLQAFEKATGDMFTINHESVDKLWDESAPKFKEGGPETRQALINMIVAAFYGKGGLTKYSADQGLWNAKLGLPKEDLDQVVHDMVLRNKW